MESKIYHLVPERSGENLLNYKQEDLVRISWTYLHGDVEHKAKYDIFSFYKEAPEDEGIFDGFVEFPDTKVQVKIFLWRATLRDKGLQGLVVAIDDKECLADAQGKYDRKEYSI